MILPFFPSVFTVNTLTLSCFLYKCEYALAVLITQHQCFPFVTSFVVLCKANMQQGIITDSSMLIKERALI